MDPFNPILAEHHVKRVAFWKVIAAQAFMFALFGAGAAALVWWFVVLLFSLERIY